MSADASGMTISSANRNASACEARAISTLLRVERPGPAALRPGDWLRAWANGASDRSLARRRRARGVADERECSGDVIGRDQGRGVEVGEGLGDAQALRYLGGGENPRSGQGAEDVLHVAR